MEDLKDIIEAWRRDALNSLNTIMTDAFEDIRAYLNEWEKTTGEVLTEKGCDGISTRTLKQLSQCGTDDLDKLICGPDRSKFIMEFLGINSLRIKEFRAKYPNAYAKWDRTADVQLLEERRRGASLQQLAQTLGRNVNAIKIRLEKLGAGDDETADASPRYPASRL